MSALSLLSSSESHIAPACYTVSRVPKCVRTASAKLEKQRSAPHDVARCVSSDPATSEISRNTSDSSCCMPTVDVRSNLVRTARPAGRL
jgi:hypothetical protein